MCRLCVDVVKNEIWMISNSNKLRRTKNDSNLSYHFIDIYFAVKMKFFCSSLYRVDIIIFYRLYSDEVKSFFSFIS